MSLPPEERLRLKDMHVNHVHEPSACIVDLMLSYCSNEELLSNLLFKICRSCGDLVLVCGFDTVFERNACDDFGQVIKAALLPPVLLSALPLL
jgi:hypothetical protein